jgi:hypothetical protein
MRRAIALTVTKLCAVRECLIQSQKQIVNDSGVGIIINRNSGGCMWAKDNSDAALNATFSYRFAHLGSDVIKFSRWSDNVYS